MVYAVPEGIVRWIDGDGDGDIWSFLFIFKISFINFRSLSPIKEIDRPDLISNYLNIVLIFYYDSLTILLLLFFQLDECIVLMYWACAYL
jgi:hypothetical protein